MKVIVTNEFRRTGSGSEQRPVRLLTAPGEAPKLVIARYTKRAVQPKRPRDITDQDIIWTAVRVGAVCAALAFAFFLFSQRNGFRRSGEEAAAAGTEVERLHFTGSKSSVAPNRRASVSAPSALPAPKAAAEDAKTTSAPPPVVPPSFPVPDSPDAITTEFNLPVNPEFQPVGQVQLRLSAVNAAAQTYDITVRTQRREFYRQDVKILESVPLSLNDADAAELVVGAIADNRAYGYVVEPDPAATASHGRRHRRRR